MARKVRVLIIGSGAAGLCAAARLSALGVESYIYTEGLNRGTSINTGSDKQTYYKLGMCGSTLDSPVDMARDIAAGGSMHGDIALAEAATSTIAFSHLVALGVPFPHDQFGQYAGYKTDHDPRCRATSCGPYTSREICRALLAEVRRRGIPIREGVTAVKLLRCGKRCIGAVFAPTDGSPGLETVVADDVIFATGGPGSFYRDSVYPESQIGGIGLALEIGAEAWNLCEGQFGLASTDFRWNVSGSYMQALPRFISVDTDGTEREFLREYYPDAATLYGNIFLKGYQWPFSASHVADRGSSLLDIFVYEETVVRGRKVYLDYRTDPEDLSLEMLPEEARTYLEKCGALQYSPIERLAAINEPAIELYHEHGIDLRRTPLRVAVCAQHCNGGLAVDNHWESTNIQHLFPIGEVAGTHGATRPGGTALNAGQVGAFRAAERIARRAPKPLTPAMLQFAESAERTLPRSGGYSAHIIDIVQEIMSTCASFLRTPLATKNGINKLECILDNPHFSTALELRDRSIAIAALCMLSSMAMQVAVVGSRGGSIVIKEYVEDSSQLKLGTDLKFVPENIEYRKKILSCVWQGSYPQIKWKRCRPVPDPDIWFEQIWKEFRSGV